MYKYKNMKKQKKVYVALQPLKISSLGRTVDLPKGMTAILGVFTSKKEALKYSEEIIEARL